MTVVLSIFISITIIASAFGIGWILGSNLESTTHELCRKEDMRLAQRLINEQYKQGYNAGVRDTEERYAQSRLENTEEAT